MADRVRVNITLDGEHASKLSRLAQRAELQEGTLARSLLSRAIDAADADAANVLELLDGIDGAFDRALRGREHAAAGRTRALDDF